MKETLLENLDMEKQELKNKIEEVVNNIKTNSKDTKFADSLVGKLLSLKGQMDVEPMRLCIPEKDVIKEYDNDSIRFVRCKGGILFQTKGGFSVFVSPRMSGLYQHLEILLDMKDKYEELSEEQKKSYEVLYLATTEILQLPIFSTCDDEFFFGIAEDIINRFQTMTDKELNKDLQEETYKENAEFENKMGIANQVLLGDKNERTIG